MSLAGCYYNGEGVVKDLERAVAWYMKAAEQNDANAQYNVGWCYKKGEGVAENLERAVEWWTKAAGQGFENAQEVLREHGVNENKWPTTTD